MLRTTFAIATATALSTAAFAQDDEISWKATEVGTGLYMLEGEGGFPGGNLGLMSGSDGKVLIDNGLATTTAMTVATIERMTDGPVNFVVNTHAHGDHTGSNHAFTAAGATVVAHNNLRQALIEDETFDQSGLPELTFDESVTFHLNGHTSYIFFIPMAHTSGDAAIHFTEANVIHAGDVFFNKVFPFIDIDGGGSVAGFIAGQQKLLSMANADTKIIPGHGPLASLNDLQTAVDMLIDARSRINTLVDAGRSIDAILAENPLSVYNSWSWDFITTEIMTRTIHRELTAE